ncbi:MAG: hypothetical protein AVDCRST_MAG20-283, partial [uncultured Acidimicrobiales bacterium]
CFAGCANRRSHPGRTTPQPPTAGATAWPPSDTWMSTPPSRTSAGWAVAGDRTCASCTAVARARSGARRGSTAGGASWSGWSSPCAPSRCCGGWRRCSVTPPSHHRRRGRSTSSNRVTPTGPSRRRSTATATSPAPSTPSARRTAGGSSRSATGSCCRV